MQITSRYDKTTRRVVKLQAQAETAPDEMLLTALREFMTGGGVVMVQCVGQRQRVFTLPERQSDERESRADGGE